MVRARKARVALQTPLLTGRLLAACYDAAGASRGSRIFTSHERKGTNRKASPCLTGDRWLTATADLLRVEAPSLPLNSRRAPDDFTADVSTGRCSHASAINHVHACAARLAHLRDDVIRLVKRRER